VKNTSEGLSFVAYGLDWQAGDNVVGIRQEFPSNRFPWQLQPVVMAILAIEEKLAV
jgi:selenocysteine lyase/cysteine desulfurase